MPADQEIPPGLVENLLALPTREEQTELLRTESLLNAVGLDRLLDIAARFVHTDPAVARELAVLCTKIPVDSTGSAFVPRAKYMLAEIYGLRGDFDSYLRLTEEAHEDYTVLGLNLEALRTNVGKMAALLELGRYEEALDVGNKVLDIVEGEEDPEVQLARPQADLLTALVAQNRGGCFEYMGFYDKALEVYELAEQLYTKLGLVERIGDVNTDRGAVLSLLGQTNAALLAHEVAARIYANNNLTLRYALALHNIGETQLQLSNYTRSLKTLEQARSLYSSRGAASYEHLLTLDIGNNYLALNLYSEALSAYQEAERLLKAAGMSHDRARALWGMGSALVAVSRLSEGESVLESAANLFFAAGNAPLLSGVMLEQASLKAARGEHGAAKSMALQALELLSPKDEYPVQSVYVRLRLADLLLSNDIVAAETHLLEASRLADNLALPQLRYRLNERLGRLRRLQGRDEEAAPLLEAAVEEIERLRGTVAQETVRASFLRDKTSAYEELLRLHLDRKDERSLQRAFAIAEQAKSRTLVDLLTGIVDAGPALGDPELKDRFGELQSDLNATYNCMLDGAADGDGGVPLSDLRARAAGLEAEINRLKLRAAAAGETTSVFGDAVSPGEAGERLPPDVTLVAYHVIGDEVVAFVNAEGDIHVARRVGSASGVRCLLRKLAVQWERVAAGGGLAGRHAALLERSARQVLGDLYDGLVAPLESLLEETVRAPGDGSRVPKLAVVPHGPLHQVPFHALFDGERYLIERFEVSYAPSATVFALCQDRASCGPGKALVVGVEDPAIPATIPEARSVTRHLPGAEVLAGEAATVAALRESSAGCGVLHLATHGLFRSDNPMFSSLKLNDGWLMAHDVMGLDLNGALVALSACESGRSGVIGGDETLGLSRAFLGAGAATLVVGLWVVQDETTASLMQSW